MVKGNKQGDAKRAGSRSRNNNRTKMYTIYN